MEIIARASVGDSTQKGVREKVADFVQRTSCIRKVKIKIKYHGYLNRARRMRP